MSKPEGMPKPAPAASSLITASPEMKALVARARRVASSGLPVLIHGETGTGKELLAEEIHRSSPRRLSRFVAVNCAALPPSLLASTLFGHVRGAFTGAQVDTKGLFEAADGGTLFLDEVAELSLEAQASLLRVLESKVLLRVGSNDSIPVDVRIVAASHRDLELSVTRGAFRQDLLYRLNTVTLELPPLRTRPDDVVGLARTFLEMRLASGESEIRELASDAIEALTSYGWPGNVRELRNAIDYAAVTSSGPILKRVDLPERIRSAEPCRPAVAEATHQILDYDARMKTAELAILLEALSKAGGKQQEAAKILAMPLRTLKYRLAKLGVRKRGRADIAEDPRFTRH